MTRTGTALVAGLTAAVTGWFVLAVGYAWSVAVGGVGTLLLAGVLQAQRRERYRPVAAVGTALALPVVGGTLLVAVGDVAADQIRATALPGTAPFVACVLVALFGAALTARDALDRTGLVRTLGVGVRVFVLLGGAVGVLATQRLTPLGDPVAAAGEAARVALVDPPAGEVHLGVWLALVAVAAGGLAAALRWLPVAALFPDPDRREQVERLARGLAVAVLGLAVLALVAVVLEAAGDPYTGLSPGLRGSLAGLTGAGAVRWLLIAVAVGSLGPAAVGRLFQNSYRADAHAALDTAGPYVGGGAVLGAALLGSDSLVAALRAELADRVPEAARSGFQELATDVTEFYGTELLALGALVLSVSVALLAVGLLTAAVLSSFVPERAGGPAIAGSGVFAASAMATVLAVPLWTGFLGAVTGVVVWDAGSFGATVRRELAGAPSIRTELLHALGALGIGVVTGVVAVGVASLSSLLPAGSGPPAVALVAALVGAALFGVASR